MSIRRLRPRPPRDGRGRFVDYSGTQRSAPTRWHLPTTEYDVQTAVARCAASGRKLRVVGAGHSFSPVAVPSGDAMSLDHLTGDIQLAADRRTVTVPAGMRLRDLSARLAAHNLSLPVVGSVQAQSVAGAIATGTHGSSLTHGNLATLVTSLRLVDGAGATTTLDSDDPRLAGARVHVGALGVVTSATLRVVPGRTLRQTVEHVPVADVPDQLAAIATGAEWVKVWWLPHASRAQIVRYEVTADEPTRRPSAETQRWVDERVMHRFAFPVMIALQHRRPAVTAGLNEWLSARYLGRDVQVGRDMVMLNTPMPLRHRETEAAVPLTDAADAVKRLLDIFRDGRPAANFPLEIRFVRGDDSWLSPAYGADTCQIGAYTTNGPDCASYFDAFWQVMRPMGARPHWGKEFDHDAGELRRLYPRYADFLALRAELDPAGVFAGGVHDRIFGGD
jgi:FAD/FMN-containing dehydrogenase